MTNKILQNIEIRNLWVRKVLMNVETIWFKKTFPNPIQTILDSFYMCLSRLYKCLSQLYKLVAFCCIGPSWNHNWLGKSVLGWWGPKSCCCCCWWWCWSSSSRSRLMWRSWWKTLCVVLSGLASSHFFLSPLRLAMFSPFLMTSSVSSPLVFTSKLLRQTLQPLLTCHLISCKSTKLHVLSGNKMWAEVAVV